MNDKLVNMTQIGGGHYKGTTYQHWDFVIQALEGRYLEGNITKYVTRHRKKNGLQDLLKARHYLDKLIEQYNLGFVSPLVQPHRLVHHQTPEHFCDVNGLDVSERNFVVLLSNWHSRADLNIAGRMLDAMIDRERYADEEERTAEAGPGYVNQD